jgi:hypothetical protein
LVLLDLYTWLPNKRGVPTALDELVDHVLGVLVLLVPPGPKEGGLHLDIPTTHNRTSSRRKYKMSYSQISSKSVEYSSFT